MLWNQNSKKKPIIYDILKQSFANYTALYQIILSVQSKPVQRAGVNKVTQANIL